MTYAVIALVAVVILALCWAMYRARADGRAVERLEQEQQRADANERIAHAATNTDRDPAALAKRLRDSGGL